MTTVIDRPETDNAFKSFMQNLQASKPDDETEKPPMYAVVLHNDATTFPDFVVKVLVGAFQMDKQAAEALMYTVHLSKDGVVCVRPKDVAETQLEAARAMIAAAKKEDYASWRVPACELTFTIQPE